MASLKTLRADREARQIIDRARTRDRRHGGSVLDLLLFVVDEARQAEQRRAVSSAPTPGAGPPDEPADRPGPGPGGRE